MELAGIRKNEADVEWSLDRSPKGNFESYNRSVSLELSAEARDPLGAAKARPFEVELVRLAPGRTNCPRHSHSMQWEYYIVVSGHGQMLQADGEEPIPMEPGDHVIQPPGWIHTVSNSGGEDLTYYVIADNPVDETCHYPDSRKWYAAGHLFRMTDVGYWDGEE